MSELGDIGDLLEGLKDRRVLVVGDVMLDRYVFGTVDRISPEAPIPVLHVGREQSMLGGAGNVVRNAVALGARATLAGVTGDDGPGAEIARLLEVEANVDSRLITVPGRLTTVKSRYLAAGQQLLRADSETTDAIAPATAAELSAIIADALPEHDVLVLTDYAKGVLTHAVLSAAIAGARAAKMPVIADPKGRNYGRYRGVSVLTPNRAELAAAMAMPCGSMQEAAVAARRVIEEHGVDAVLVTLSEHGMVLITGEGDAVELEAQAREVFDVSGAGDTVMATLAAGLAAGLGLETAARLANLAGGIVVGKLGTAVLYPKELAAALHVGDLKSAEAKIRALDLALDQVGQWRLRGERIGFTNGCFDLIHPGHVSLLSQAKAACDRLVVGLNSDDSARRLKGEGRPVQSESARAAVLASLEAVDAVVIFSEATPIDLIGALKPDVLVKGADYTIDEVVGADLVREHGGEVLLAELEPGHSTTGTIAKLVG